MSKLIVIGGRRVGKSDAARKLKLLFDHIEPRHRRVALADADQADIGRTVNASAWKPDLETYDNNQALYRRAA